MFSTIAFFFFFVAFFFFFNLLFGDSSSYGGDLNLLILSVGEFIIVLTLREWTLLTKRELSWYSRFTSLSTVGPTTNITINAYPRI
jgi:hypothetical protein